MMNIQSLDGRADLGSSLASSLRPSVSVAILDAETLFREGIQQILTSHGQFEVALELAEASELPDFGEIDDVEVLLFGLGVAPEADLHQLELLLVDRPQTRVLVLSPHDQAYLVRTAIELGAAGYLLKTASIAELVRAVLLVADGYPYIQGHLASTLVASDNGGSVARTPRLSPRQLEILRLVTQGLRNKQIAHRLDISETTVKSHLRVIYSQLETTSRTEAVATALRRGLVT